MCYSRITSTQSEQQSESFQIISTRKFALDSVLVSSLSILTNSSYAALDGKVIDAVALPSVHMYSTRRLMNSFGEAPGTPFSFAEHSCHK